MKNLFLKSNKLYWATNMFACLLCVLSVGVGYIEGFPKLDVNENKVLENELALAMVESSNKLEEKEGTEEIVVEAKAKASYNNTYYVTPVGNPNGRSLVDYALSLVGTSRSNYNRGDCTGFVQFVFSKYGYNLPSSVRSYTNQGTAVSYNDLQPGDVVITNNWGHVGIYVGNGMIVHNPGYGNRTVTTAYLGSSSTLNFVTARRFYVAAPKVEENVEEKEEKKESTDDVYSQSVIDTDKNENLEEQNINTDQNTNVNQDTNINQNIEADLNTQEKVEE